jgi:hypothetical protein
VHGLNRPRQARRQGAETQSAGLVTIQVPRAVRIALAEISQMTGKSEADELAAMILARRKVINQRKGQTLLKREETNGIRAAKHEDSMQLLLTI